MSYYVSTMPEQPVAVGRGDQEPTSPMRDLILDVVRWRALHAFLRDYPSMARQQASRYLTAAAREFVLGAGHSDET